MKKQPWCSFSLAGVSLTDFGLEIPSPFVSLELTNAELESMAWTLRCTVGGDASRKINIAAFEALIYSAAQAASSYAVSQNIPVSFAFGWLDSAGNVSDYLSFQGFTLTFKVSTSGVYMQYELSGRAEMVPKGNSPVLNIPEVQGFVQPSAVLVALAIASKATSYYTLDVDRNDAATLVSHGAMTTSFTKYVRGGVKGSDDYDAWPGLQPLSKSYSGSRDAAGLLYPYTKLSTLTNLLTVSPLNKFLKKSNTDLTPQQSSFSFWIDEPTMTQPGIIHYKSNAGLATSQVPDALKYGTSDSNILSLSGSYNGIAYTMQDMSFSSVGFSVDAEGNSVIQDAKVVNSWSASLSDVFQSVNIINDVSAIATQFSGDFRVVIPGSAKEYSVAQPVTLLVMSGNTLSPITGIYNIMRVTHSVSSTFLTTLSLKRLNLSNANQIASYQGIYTAGGTDTSRRYRNNSYTTTSNIKSTGLVDFGEIYPTFEDIYNAPY